MLTPAQPPQIPIPRGASLNVHWAQTPPSRPPAQGLRPRCPPAGCGTNLKLCGRGVDGGDTPDRRESPLASIAHKPSGPSLSVARELAVPKGCTRFEDGQPDTGLSRAASRAAPATRSWKAATACAASALAVMPLHPASARSANPTRLHTLLLQYPPRPDSLPTSVERGAARSTPCMRGGSDASGWLISIGSRPYLSASAAGAGQRGLGPRLGPETFVVQMLG
ncbi:uncharacterized protein FIBRA_08830 [Fibroporia radiculosa]|uniref:Uncharacterized protein n=1 Tax=Fibroporia radiculosa TaxID=599839 RepID=J4GXH1_9APHY|nr:uncharacterized protein FIBRA_08830 [Fibroporia radiculosa]CCM06555.1 predicted protein [Fibroporia radiculosa]